MLLVEANFSNAGSYVTVTFIWADRRGRCAHETHEMHCFPPFLHTVRDRCHVSVNSHVNWVMVRTGPIYFLTETDR